MTPRGRGNESAWALGIGAALFAVAYVAIRADGWWAVLGWVVLVVALLELLFATTRWTSGR